MKKGMHVMAVLLAGMIFLQIGFMICCYQNYLDKMDILNRVAVSDAQSGLDTAIEILKAEDVKNTENTKKTDKTLVLEQYGYRQSLRNRYFARFLKQCLFLTAGTALFLAVFLTVLYVREKQENKRNQVYLKSLGQYLDGFREAGMRQQASEAYPELPVPKGCEAEAESIRGQLEMLQAQLRAVQEQAFTEKERTKSLVTDLSHQLKTPVAALDTCFTILEDQTLSEAERAEFDGRCRNELEGLKTLLEALVQISHMEAGMIQIVPEQALLLDTLLEAVNRIYPKASAKQVELVFDYSPDLEQTEIDQDRKWLCEAFINLLDNAVKYSPAGSEIRISIQKLVSFIRIEIEDQGIGIPGSEQHKVFQRFYRGTDHRVKAENGSGVGLYLVRRIIGEHHGTVSVRSGKGRKNGHAGSIFIVQLPVLNLTKL